MVLFWAVTQCGLLGKYQCVGGSYSLCLQGDNQKQGKTTANSWYLVCIQEEYHFATEHTEDGGDVFLQNIGNHLHHAHLQWNWLT
jgi:hypothetical protein